MSRQDKSGKRFDLRRTGDYQVWDEWMRNYTSSEKAMNLKDFVASLTEQQRASLVELLRLFNAVSEGRKP